MRRDTGFSKAVSAAIMLRDGGCVRCGGACHGERGRDFSLQHRRARGMGGSRRQDTNEPQNGIVLCGSATSAGGCHQWVESNRLAARDHGWAIWQSEDPLTVIVDHRQLGMVFLHSNGSWGSKPEAVSTLEGAA